MDHSIILQQRMITSKKSLIHPLTDRFSCTNSVYFMSRWTCRQWSVYFHSGTLQLFSAVDAGRCPIATRTEPWMTVCIVTLNTPLKYWWKVSNTSQFNRAGPTHPWVCVHASVDLDNSSKSDVLCFQTQHILHPWVYLCKHRSWWQVQVFNIHSPVCLCMHTSWR